MQVGPSSFKELKQYIIQDLKWTGGHVVRTFLSRYIFEPGFKYTFWLRLTRFMYLRWGMPMAVIPGVFLKHYSYKYHFDISFRAQIGPGLTIGHMGYIIVTSDTVIGQNCMLRPGVVFGKKISGNNDHGCTVGDNVSFGVGSKIVGKRYIGNNVIVGANAVITHDVPSNCTVAGVPARVINENL